MRCARQGAQLDHPLLPACLLACLPAGGIFVGKTNLDQFACGLVGTRTPYGIPGAQAAGMAPISGDSWRRRRVPIAQCSAPEENSSSN
jgi:hypothetical protein